MAPKRHLQDPPASSSTEDELEESENDAVEEETNGVSDGVEYEDEKSEDDEEDDHHNMTNKSTATAFSKASERQSSSDSGDGSTEESDSDSDSDKTQPSPSVSDFTVKPIVSKPTNDTGKPPKNAAKRNLALSATTIAGGGSKRSNESNTQEKESKKKKVSNGQDEDVKKGSGVQRLWNEDDEMAILKGMIDYQSKKGADPCADMAVFHEYIKNNLHAEVSKNQLASKVRTLKKKFQRNATKGENGEDPVFSKPPDHKIFELSKKVWGDAATTNGVDKRKPIPSKGKNSLPSASPKLEMDVKNEKPNGETNDEPSKSCSNSSFLDRMLASGELILPESAMSIVKEAMPLIGNSKAKELERKWKKLQEDEFLLYIKRVELIHETAKLLLDAMKSST